MIESGGKYGLNLNKLKTKIIQVRGKKNIKNIGEYAVEVVQYLGIKIGGRGRNIFQAEKKIWLEKARKKANELIPQIKKNFDKVVVGKSYLEANVCPRYPIWKSCSCNSENYH